MSGDPTRTPSKPKLRTSCDQCGAAKVRCDRNQPECGRCVSHGWPCVYGVSRKMGKPPRGKHRQSFKRASGGGSTPPGTAPDGHSKLDGSTTSSDGTFGPDRNFHRASLTYSTAVWDVGCLGLDAPDMLSDLTRSYLPASPSLDFGDWGALPDSFAAESHHFGPILTPESLGSYAPTEASTAHPTAHQSPSDSTLLPAPGFEGHDCLREAHEILRNLSFDREELHHSPASSRSQVPLDHVLRINCEARDRLGPLLACNCARSPHLALVYAAIISRVLMWYQEAAGHTPAQQQQQPHSSGSSSSNHQPSWSQALAEGMPSSSGGDTRSAAAMLSQSPAAIAFGPAKMAIGTFSVDDLGIQTALKMQLLAGEMKRAGCLIDQFTSLNTGGHESNFDGVDKLYQSLHLWLRGEHSRIAGMMRLKLRELNT